MSGASQIEPGLAIRFQQHLHIKALPPSRNGG